MMTLRLRTLLSLTLALVLVWTSGLQAARASFEGGSSLPMTAQSHYGMVIDSHARHGDHANHDHTETAPQDQRSCLLTCLDATPQNYLAAQATRTSAPDLSALYPFPTSQISYSHKRHDPASIHQAPRGPPRSPGLLTNAGTRALLLQTARFRI